MEGVPAGFLLVLLSVPFYPRERERERGYFNVAELQLRNSISIHTQVNYSYKLQPNYFILGNY